MPLRFSSPAAASGHGELWCRSIAPSPLAVFLGPAVFFLLSLPLWRPLHQSLAYHHFHDARALLGIPNIWNVISNLPFLVVGATALLWLARGRHRLPPPLARCYRVLFTGVAMTALGSAIYHWAPGNATLVWDRLPMAVGFMGLYAALLAERMRLDAVATKRLLVVLLAYGIGSVIYWAATDDLRPYVLAQFYPLLTIPLILWIFPAQYTRGGDWLVALAIYAAAKALEDADGLVFGLGHLISGHTLKHMVAAAGAAWLLRMLMTRREVRSQI